MRHIIIGGEEETKGMAKDVADSADIIISKSNTGGYRVIKDTNGTCDQPIERRDLEKLGDSI